MTSTRTITVRRALSSDLDTVALILTQAALWLDERGDPLWSVDELDPQHLRDDVARGFYVIAEHTDEAVAVARVTGEDPETWPEAEPGEALYVHRLAVLRSHSGGIASRPVLSWCRAQAQEHDIPLLRLDCDVRRERLRSLYASFGFEFHSETTVGTYRVARFELPVWKQQRPAITADE